LAAIGCELIDSDLYVDLSDNPTVDILTGQSNAVQGYCTTLNIPEEYKGIKNTRFILDNYTGTVNKVNATYNTGGIGIGVQNVYAEEVILLKGSDNFLSNSASVIKMAMGSTAISGWLKDSGTVWYHLITAINDYINYCTEHSITPTFRSLLWMQGESDCLGGTLGTYETALTNFINNIRAHNVALTNMKIVLCKLDTDMTGLNAADIITINGIFDTVAGAMTDVVILNPNDYVLTMENNLHYSAASVLTLGEKWSDIVNV